MRLLIAEDDRNLGAFLQRSLAGATDTVEVVGDGALAVEAFLRSEPDLLILDLDLPVQSGAEVLDIVRVISRTCPILVLSGRAEADTRTVCLDRGADDCMLKPFSLAELRARCNALLRRQQAAHAEQTAVAARLHAEGVGTLRFGALQLHRARRLVVAGEVKVPMRTLEFALLEQLLLAAGDTVSRQTLLAAVWPDKTIDTNVLDVHMAALRRRLRTAQQLWVEIPALVTVRGQGYRLAFTTGATPTLRGAAAGQQQRWPKND